jgi:phage terminase large subunit-like protein
LDPILFVGVDIGIKKDTSAIVALYHDYDQGRFRLWGCRIYKPPVNMITQVEPCLIRLLKTQRVALLNYDPYMMATTRQRLVEDGFGSKLSEVNQGTEMILASNILHSHLVEDTLDLFDDPELRSHFSHCNAKTGERGWRIVKASQSMPVDGVVACAMALMGATGDEDYNRHPSFQPSMHGRSIEVLP